MRINKAITNRSVESFVLRVDAAASTPYSATVIVALCDTVVTFKGLFNLKIPLKSAESSNISFMPSYSMQIRTTLLYSNTVQLTRNHTHLSQNLFHIDFMLDFKFRHRNLNTFRSHAVHNFAEITMAKLCF